MMTNYENEQSRRVIHLSLMLGVLLLAAFLLSGCTSSPKTFIGHTSCERCGDIQVSFDYNHGSRQITNLKVQFIGETAYLEGVDYPEGEEAPQCMVSDVWTFPEEIYKYNGTGMRYCTEITEPNRGGVVLEMKYLDHKYALAYLSFVAMGDIGFPWDFVDFGVMDIALAEKPEDIPENWQAQLHRDKPWQIASAYFPYENKTNTEKDGILNYIYAANSIISYKRPLYEVSKYVDPQEAYEAFKEYHEELFWLEGAKALLQDRFLTPDNASDYQFIKGSKFVLQQDGIFAFYWLYHSKSLSDNEKQLIVADYVNWIKTKVLDRTYELIGFHWLKNSGLASEVVEKDVAKSIIGDLASMKEGLSRYKDDILGLFSYFSPDELFQLIMAAHKDNNAGYLARLYREHLTANGGITVDIMRDIANTDTAGDCYWIYKPYLETLSSAQRLKLLHDIYDQDSVKLNAVLLSDVMEHMAADDTLAAVAWMRERFKDAGDNMLSIIVMSSSTDLDSRLRAMHIASDQFNNAGLNVGTRSSHTSYLIEPPIDKIAFSNINEQISDHCMTAPLPQGKLLVLDYGSQSGEYMSFYDGLYLPYNGGVEMPASRIPHSLDDVDIVVVLFDTNGKANSYTQFYTNGTSKEITIYDCVTHAVAFDFASGAALGYLGSCTTPPDMSYNRYSNVSDGYRCSSKMDKVLDWLATFY